MLSLATVYALIAVVAIACVIAVKLITGVMGAFSAHNEGHATSDEAMPLSVRLVNQLLPEPAPESLRTLRA